MACLHPQVKLSTHLVLLHLVLDVLQVGTQRLRPHPLDASLGHVQPVCELLQLLVLQVHQHLVEPVGRVEEGGGGWGQGRSQLFVSTTTLRTPESRPRLHSLVLFINNIITDNRSA